MINLSNKTCKEYLIYFAPVFLLVYLVLETYQIDFRVFYVAGKSVLYNLDPYLNHVSQFPELYVPVNAHDAPTSGFLYPPFAALLFAPLGFFSYAIAKMIFSLIIIFILIIFSFHFLRKSQFKLPGEAILFIMCSFPIFATFERGQIDTLVMYLTFLSFDVFQNRKPNSFLTASFLLAISSCIKIFPIVTLLYYLVNKRFKYLISAILFTTLLFFLPLLYFDFSVYQHFFQVILPNIFGEITTSETINTHGQNVVNNLVIAIGNTGLENTGLLASRNLSNGYMNPFLKNNTLGALLIGLAAMISLLILNRKNSKEYQFYAILNTINLFNPKAWIMGLVWYFPTFFSLYPQVNKWGKFVILIPIFMPPFTNTNAMLAVVITLLFSVCLNNQKFGRYLLKREYINQDNETTI
ncbi:hypothetical protein SR1949_13460 [Sphaerospermopsis reniformis]|uniref:DUF2029 domain-containing protein n=1 Tax=Sphaerospermopsis reniformis TaxID=531300 RepID=A0A480A252_9CYAN|nr:glycosyltransferase family 87 protein [Sphaerospermopsis reniformis]GCL36244.1 hypothetical protein SR1949_13460 [Sphaerospermopsis reniformis]